MSVFKSRALAAEKTLKELTGEIYQLKQKTEGEADSRAALVDQMEGDKKRLKDRIAELESGSAALALKLEQEVDQRRAEAISFNERSQKLEEELRSSKDEVARLANAADRLELVSFELKSQLLDARK